VSGLDQATKQWLAGRGYNPIELMTLPRETVDDHRQYLLARCQGMAEGTIMFSDDDRKVLELEMRTYGMLNPTSTSMSIQVKCNAEDINSMMNWTASRHTLANNSTSIAAELPKTSTKSAKKDSNK
jgi:hypothetical protein